MDGQTAKWHWCPTRAQEGDSRYTLVLAADDGENPKTVKNYLVVLRGNTRHELPGHGAGDRAHLVEPEHAPRPQAAANVTDDKGLKDAPLFYYSFTNPGATPVLSADDAAHDGEAVAARNTSGSWAPTLPNPVATCRRRHDEDDLLRVRRRR